MQGKEKFVVWSPAFVLFEDGDNDDFPLACRNADNF